MSCFYVSLRLGLVIMSRTAACGYRPKTLLSVGVRDLVNCTVPMWKSVLCFLKSHRMFQKVDREYMWRMHRYIVVDYESCVHIHVHEN